MRLRRRWSWLGILLALVLVGAIAFRVGASEAVRTCEQQQKSGQAAPNGYGLRGYQVVSERCVWEFIEANDRALMVLATIALFGVAAAQALLFRRQLNLMGVTLRDAHREFIATFRPRLVVRQMYRIRGEGENIIRFAVFNVGGSEAHIVSGRARLFPREQRRSIPTIPLEGTKAFVADVTAEPGAPIVLEWRETDEPGFQLTGADIFGYGGDLYFLGTVIYEDKIGIRRNVGFCRLYDSASWRFGALNDPDLEEFEYSD